MVTVGLLLKFSEALTFREGSTPPKIRIRQKMPVMQYNFPLFILFSSILCNIAIFIIKDYPRDVKTKTCCEGKKYEFHIPYIGFSTTKIKDSSRQAIEKSGHCPLPHCKFNFISILMYSIRKKSYLLSQLLHNRFLLEYHISWKSLSLSYNKLQYFYPLYMLLKNSQKNYR